MESTQPGLVPRIDGRHTKNRITSVSVFLDDSSGHRYFHVQTSIGGDETLADKRAYEIMAHSRAVSVQGCHADNDIFAKKTIQG